MESVKREACEDLQQQTAEDLATLLAQLVTREPCPNTKVLVNLKAFLRLVEIWVCEQNLGLSGEIYNLSAIALVFL